MKVNSLVEDIDFAESFDAIQSYNFQSFIFPLHPVMEKMKSALNFWDNKRKTITQHLKVVDKFCYNIINDRKKLLQDSDQTGENNNASFNEDTDLLHRFMKSNNTDGSRYTDKDLRDSMLNFIVAGRDTSAQTLSWFFYNVMLHPRIEQRLLGEISKYIVDDIEKDTVAFYEATKKMIYFRAVYVDVCIVYCIVILD